MREVLSNYEVAKGLALCWWLMVRMHEKKHAEAVTCAECIVLSIYEMDFYLVLRLFIFCWQFTNYYVFVQCNVINRTYINFK